MTALTPAAILLAAADHCDEVGLHKGELWPGAATGYRDYVHGDPCCAIGHIRVAAGITSFEVGVGDWDRTGAAEAEGALQDYIEDIGYDEDIPGWSDDYDRTASDVSSALRAAAGGAA